MTWYKTLFEQEDPIRYGIYAESDSSRAQVDFVIEKTGVEPGARVLDLCCGQGRHLLELIRRGYSGVGADLSEYMLSKCREVAEEDGIPVELIRCDMREIDFESDFDLVINMFTAFGYLESDDEDQKVLGAIGKALKPGGVFFIDMMGRDGLMRRFKPRHWDENSRGDIVVAERKMDMLTGRIDCREVELFADGSRREVNHSIRVYTFTELEKMLNQAGIKVESTWGGFDGSDFTMDSSRMIVVGRKNFT